MAHDTVAVRLLTSFLLHRSVLCLVLGSAYRARGGAALQRVLPATVDALVAVASRPIGAAHVWALHSLWLTATAAGAAFEPHVGRSLQLAMELLVSSCSCSNSSSNSGRAVLCGLPACPFSAVDACIAGCHRRNHSSAQLVIA
jgi:hypothetical protein